MDSARVLPSVSLWVICERASLVFLLITTWVEVSTALIIGIPAESSKDNVLEKLEISRYFSKLPKRGNLKKTPTTLALISFFDIRNRKIARESIAAAVRIR